MSWIFALLLTMYGSVRVTLWVRGQVRYLRVRGELPEVPEFRRISPPEHLPPRLGRLHSEVRATIHALRLEIRTLATVELVDPDVPFGAIRDFRYRKSLIQTRNHLVRWHRRIEKLPIEDLTRLEGLGFSLEGLENLCSTLEDPFRVAVAARALEAFPVATLRQVRHCYARICVELEQLRQTLECLDAHPYRPSPSSRASSAASVGSLAVAADTRPRPAPACASLA